MCVSQPHGRERPIPRLNAPARYAALMYISKIELLHVLMLPDFERADPDRHVPGSPRRRTFGELLIDLEEDKAARAVLVGILREADHQTDGRGTRWRCRIPRVERGSGA
jgi:hypothetical protein